MGKSGQREPVDGLEQHWHSTAARRAVSPAGWLARAVAAKLPVSGEILVALACAAVAVGMRYVLDFLLGTEHVYTIAFAATSVAALLAGWRAGLLCAIVAQVASNVLFLAPRGSFTPLPVDPAGVTFYLMTAVLLCAAQIAVRSLRVLRILVERLDAADAAKSELLAIVAHELRSPVSAIGLALRRLQATAGGEAAERPIGAIGRQLAHIVRLVDDLTDASRVEAGKVPLQMRQQDVGDLLSRARELVESSLEQRRQLLRVAAGEALVVRADADRLVQVLANLLQNASKYSPEHSTIVVEAFAAGPSVCVDVTDEGEGIPPEQLERVFDTYAQLQPGGEGLGLGLALVRKLVHMHGGSVQALRGRGGKGSTFRVCLPSASPGMPAPRGFPEAVPRRLG